MATIRVKILGDSSSLERSFKRANSSAKGFNKSMSGTSTSSKRGQGAMRGLGSSVRLAGGAFLGGAGIVAGITSTLRKTAEFERSMNVFQAVTKANAAEMKAAGAEAVKLGSDITLPGTSAKDAALAMTELAKGGLSVQQSIAAGKGTLQLAAAASVEVAEAATISARALNAFSLGGDQAGRVADVLANAANVSTGEITDFADALQQASATAKQSGLSIEDTTAALAELANKGIVGSDAGTSLKTMLTRLIAPTDKARKVMEELGVKTSDASGNLLPFRDQIAQYQKALKKLTPAQRAQAINTIFGSDAQRAANVILGGGVESFDKMHKAVSTQGAAARIAAAKNKGLAGSMDALASAVETVQIQLGTVLTPALTKNLQAAAKWLGNAKNQKAILEGFKTAAAAVSDVLGTLRTIFGALSSVVGGNKTAIKLLIGAFIAFKLLKMAGTIAGIATQFGLMGGKARGAAGGMRGAKGAATGFRGSLVGKAGLAGAVVLAGIALSKLIRKIPGWDGWMKTFGSTIGDLATKFGLLNDPMKEFEGKKLPTQVLAKQLRQRARTLHNKGLSDVQVQQRIGRENPNVAARDIKTLTGSFLARLPDKPPAVTINVYQRPNESGPALARRIKEEQLKAEKRNTIQRRGAVSGR